MGQTFVGKQIANKKFAICCTTDHYETLELRDSCRSRRPSKMIQIPSKPQVTSDQHHPVISVNNLLSPIRTSSIGESSINSIKVDMLRVFSSNETWDEDIGESESVTQQKLASMRKLINEYDDEIQNCKEYLSNSPQH